MVCSILCELSFFICIMRTVQSLVAPGTKWCGNNNQAQDPDDLGHLQEVDKCCKAHDFCPLVILPFTEKYGLINNSTYSRMSCDCDLKLYQCFDIISGLEYIYGQVLKAIYAYFVNICFIEDLSHPGNYCWSNPTLIASKSKSDETNNQRILLDSNKTESLLLN